MVNAMMGLRFHVKANIFVNELFVHADVDHTHKLISFNTSFELFIFFTGDGDANERNTNPVNHVTDATDAGDVGSTNGDAGVAASQPPDQPSSGGEESNKDKNENPTSLSLEETKLVSMNVIYCLNNIFTARISNGMREGNVFIGVCLSTPVGGGGVPHLHPIILPLVPCPFRG